MAKEIKTKVEDNEAEVEKTKANENKNTEDDALDAEFASPGSVYVHKFKTPVKIGDKEYESLTFNFGKLTGKDFQLIEDEVNREGKAVVTAAYSGAFLKQMAVRACKESVGADDFDLLPLKEYDAIRKQARNFMMD